MLAEMAALRAQLREQQIENARLQRRWREAEAQLVHARAKPGERRLETILDSMPGAVAYWDTDLILRYCNRRLRRHWAHKARSGEALIGRHMRDMLSDEGYLRTMPFVQSALHGREMTGEHRERNGFTAQVSFTPDVQDGRVHGFVVLALDISELEAAKAAAEQASRAKSAFLASMSHEIRTPLNAVLGFAQVGAMRFAQQEAGGHFAHIHRAGRHLLGLISDVLDYSRIEAGQLTLQSAELVLSDCIEQAMACLREPAAQKGLRLELARLEGVPDRWQGDALRVTQVITILLSNAVKFTARGEVRLTVGADAQGLRLVVQDTGPGMGAPLLETLFDPFVRGDGSSTRKTGGAGLGLSMCKRLVELMNGTIIVDSAPGLGARFDVILPLRAWVDVDVDAEIDATAAAMTMPMPASASLVPTLGGLRVLVAEDHRVNQIVLEQLLVNEGVHITLADNGHEAVEAVRLAGQGAFDLMLCDIEMPVMDGYEATQAIHRLDPGLPVMGLTAHAFDEARARALNVGMADYVVKPYVYEDLLRRMALHARRGYVL